MRTRCRCGCAQRLSVCGRRRRCGWRRRAARARRRRGRAPSRCCAAESSKKMSAPNASRNGPFGAAAEEQRLVQAHAPVAQGADHALVRGRRARGDQRGADRRRPRRPGTPPAGGAAHRGNRGTARRTAVRARARARGGRTLPRPARATRARLRRRRSPRRRRMRCATGRSDAARALRRAGSWPRPRHAPARVRTDSGLADRNRSAPNGRMYGQVGAPEVKVARADVQAVVLDRVEDAQAGIGGIARQQDDLDPRRAAIGAGGALRSSASSLRTSGNAMPGREQVVLVGALEGAVGVDAFALEQRVAVFQVEQRARGDRDGQRVWRCRSAWDWTTGSLMQPVSINRVSPGETACTPCRVMFRPRTAR